MNKLDKELRYCLGKYKQKVIRLELIRDDISVTDYRRFSMLHQRDAIAEIVKITGGKRKWF